MSTRPPKAGRHPGQSITWLVYRVGGTRGRMLGFVKAASYEAALAAALAEFDVSPADRKRILVQATSST